MEELKNKFRSKFNELPLLVSSPGRINLIGEHTDYHNGFVFPAAIDRYIVGAFSTNPGDTCNVQALDLGEEVTFDLNEIQPGPRGSFANHILGVVNEIRKKGELEIGGFNLMITGDIPHGAGMSSSAALGNCVAYGLNELFRLGLSKDELIKMAVASEHHFVGVACGIMDQFASMNGRKNHAIFLDCSSKEADYIPLTPDSCQFVLLNTNVKHSLADSAYNERKTECEIGVKALQKKDPEIQSLRNVTDEQLHEIKSDVSETVFNRCVYVLEENNRVIKAADSVKTGSWKELGELMYASHEGLQYKYEVSCPELDFLVDKTRLLDEVIGARMMGGGFGGCTLNLVRKNAIDSFIAQMTEAYSNQFGMKPKAYEVSPADGTGVLT